MGTHYKGNASEKRVLNSWIKLTRATNTIGRLVKGAFEKYGLTESQFGVMEILLHLGPQHQKSLADKSLVSSGNITMVINNLEREALVTRTPDPADRRAYFIVLTDKGKHLIEEAFAYHLEVLVAAFSVLENDQQEELAGLCRQLGLANSNKNE